MKVSEDSGVDRFLPLLALVIIIVASRLVYRKGIDLLIGILPRILAKYPNVKFRIGTLIDAWSMMTTPVVLFISAGNGPKEIDIREVIEREGTEDRVALGKFSFFAIRTGNERKNIFIPLDRRPSESW
jgi:phosphatidylinositol N-acetylglucosaminyltransferase subunit A